MLGRRTRMLSNPPQNPRVEVQQLEHLGDTGPGHLVLARELRPFSATSFQASLPTLGEVQGGQDLGRPPGRYVPATQAFSGRIETNDEAGLDSPTCGILGEPKATHTGSPFSLGRWIRQRIGQIEGVSVAAPPDPAADRTDRGGHFSCNGRGSAVEWKGVTIGEHLVATTRGGERALVRPQYAGWLWERLRAGLPDACSLVLMPDHVHLVAPPGRRPRLRRILAAFTVRFGVRFDVLEPQPATSVAILGRMMRYGFFNPIRAGLTDDPFAWPWSTLRDLVGAAAPIWTPLSRIASTLRQSTAATMRGLTAIGGVPGRLPHLRPVQAASILEVRGAVRSALWIVGDEITAAERRLTVQACFEIGSPRVAELAVELGCSVRSIHRDKTADRTSALTAVLLCLGDPRLRLGPTTVDSSSHGKRTG